MIQNVIVLHFYFDNILACRQEQFENSAAGRAAKAQLAAASKQSNNNSKGEPVLKVLSTIMYHYSVVDS